MTMSFSAKIKKKGINPYVVVPKQESERFKKRGYIPVKGRVNNTPFQSTLVPVGEGKYWLYINGEMRKVSGVGVGDNVRISISLASPRKVPVPNALRKALNKRAKAKIAWERLTPSHRREVLRYINYLKTPQALDRNIRKIINLLKKGARRL